MRFTFKLMDEVHAHIILTWHYQGQYTVYDMDADSDDDVSGLLDRRSPHYAVLNEREELVGFFNFGTSAQPWSTSRPRLYSENRTLDIGLGLRPDLTGKGLGLAFVNAGLAFAREHFTPTNFRLYVLTFNERAICVYERAKFEHIRVFTQQNIHGTHTFLEMRRKA